MNDALVETVARAMRFAMRPDGFEYDHSDEARGKVETRAKNYWRDFARIAIEIVAAQGIEAASAAKTERLRDAGASADADRATHERSQSSLSPPTVSVPSAADPLKLSAFICEIRDRFKARAALTDAQATLSALAALEMWEDCEEPVEFTKECAHEIADTDLEHWDD